MPKQDQEISVASTAQGLNNFTDFSAILLEKQFLESTVTNDEAWVFQQDPVPPTQKISDSNVKILYGCNIIKFQSKG